jgi:hypothetical protein
VATERSWVVVLEETTHDKASARVAQVILPAVHGVAKAVELALFQTHGGIEIVSVLFRHFVHVAKASEAVIPRDLARLVEDQTALGAAAVFELPGAYWTSIDTVLLVADDVERRAKCVRGRIEAAFEQSPGAWVSIVAVDLDGGGFFLLPLAVLFDGLAGRQQVGSSNEDGGHVTNLAKVLDKTLSRQDRHVRRAALTT